MKRCKRGVARKLAWWTDELECLRKNVRKRKRAYQRARRNDRGRVNERMREYRHAMSEYKARIWKVKEENWKRFVSESGNQDPWGDVYKVCMNKRDRVRLSGMKVGERTTSTWRESVNVLLERFFPAADMDVERDVVRDKCVCDTSFEWEKMDRADKSMRVGKAPGLDGVNVDMLRMIWRAIPVWLKGVYDACLRSGCFHVAWKTARVVVLLKSPEKVWSNPGSYRPICLLPVLGKVLERMMVERLKRKVCDRLCDAQFVFVRSRSTEGAWNCVREWVHASEKSMYSVCL